MWLRKNKQIAKGFQRDCNKLTFLTSNDYCFKIQDDETIFMLTVIFY